MTRADGMRLGVAMELAEGIIAELAETVLTCASEMGLEARRVSTANDEAHVDVLVAIGWPLLYPDLLRRARNARRVLWFLEALPGDAPSASERIHRALPTGRLLDLSTSAVPRLRRAPPVRAARETAERERERRRSARALLGHASAFDRVVVDTGERARRAGLLGLESGVIPIGWHESLAGPLVDGGAPRDINVLMIGRLGNALSRRRRILANVAAGLAERGIELTTQTEFVSGAARRALLERTRVVLGVHRHADDFEALRFVLVTPAGAALVTESGASVAPVVAGVHSVEAAPAGLAETVATLLDDEPRRRAMVAAGRELLGSQLTMARSIERLIHEAMPKTRAVSESPRPGAG